MKTQNRMHDDFRFIFLVLKTLTKIGMNRPRATKSIWKAKQFIIEFYDESTNWRFTINREKQSITIILYDESTLTDITGMVTLYSQDCINEWYRRYKQQHLLPIIKSKYNAESRPV